MYDAEMGSPGLIIDGTVFFGGEDEPLPWSESYEDMVAGLTGRQNAIRDFDRCSTRPEDG